MLKKSVRIALWLTTCLFPWVPGAARPIAGQRKRAAPQRLWNRVFPGATTIKAQGGWLIVNDDEKPISIIDPADGSTVLRLTGYSRARASPSLVTAVRSGVANGKGAASFLDAWKMPEGVKQWSCPVAESTQPGDTWNGYYYFSDVKGIHRIPLAPGKRSSELVRAFEIRGSALPGPRIGGNRLYFSDGHSIYGLDLNAPQHAWAAYCDCLVEFADVDGAYGSGTVSFNLAALRPTGKPAGVATDGLPTRRPGAQVSAAESGEHFFRVFSRGDFTVAGNAITSGGYDCVSNYSYDPPSVISEYLYVFHKLTGKLLWKKPMSAVHSVLLPGKVMVWAGHRRPKSAPHGPNRVPGIEDLEWRLETYDLETGRRLWRSPARRDPLPGLVAVGRHYFMLENGRLTGYQ